MDEFPDVLARHVSGKDALADELTLFASQPAARQAVIRERLLTLDEYLRTPNAGVAEADRAAAALGRSRRQFYRLVAKLHELGPVRALSPKYRSAETTSLARDGLDAKVEELLAAVLASKPDARISEVETSLRKKCAKHGLEPPKETTLRKRVHAIRAGGILKSEVAPFGSDLIVDQTFIDLPIGNARTSRPATATLIVDRATKLIAGLGLTDEPAQGEGLHLALEDMRGRRLDSLARAPVEVTANLGRLTWVVPPGLEEEKELLESDERPLRSVELHVLGSGARRHGELLARLLGDRLGPYTLRLRAAEHVKHDHGRVGIDLVIARQAVNACADAWNKQMIALLGGDVPVDGWRTRRLRHIGEQVSTLFRRVLSAAYHKYDWLDGQGFEIED